MKLDFKKTEKAHIVATKCFVFHPLTILWDKLGQFGVVVSFKINRAFLTGLYQVPYPSQKPRYFV